MSLIPHLPPRAFYLAEERERVIFQFQRGVGQGLSGGAEDYQLMVIPGKKVSTSANFRAKCLATFSKMARHVAGNSART